MNCLKEFKWIDELPQNRQFAVKTPQKQLRVKPMVPQSNQHDLGYFCVQTARKALSMLKGS